MAAVFDDLHSTDAQLEELWRVFNSCWVCASEELANAEELARQSPSESISAHVQMLRMQERRQRAMLDEFEHRMRTMRSRPPRYRAAQPAQRIIPRITRGQDDGAKRTDPIRGRRPGFDPG